jgi:hypothetical protein
MKPISFREVNVTLAKDQPEYLPLPVYQDGSETISCWKLSWRERFKVLFTGRMWYRQMNFRQPLQPQRPEIDCPFARDAGSRAGVYVSLYWRRFFGGQS